MTFKADDETMNSLVNGLGAVVFALARRLPSTERAAFAADIASLAKNAEAAGRTVDETLLIDLHRAALAAR